MSYVDTAAAAAYPVLKQTLIDWRAKGTGPTFIKVGASVRYDTADLDAWMTEHKVGESK